MVADIVRRLRNPSFSEERRSLGVVTFNGEQQRLIENLLDEQRRSYPELEPFFDKDRWHEPVWSTEWWMDAEVALSKLDQRLVEDLDADRAKAAAAAPIDAAVEPEIVEQNRDEPTVEPEISPPIDEMPGEPANDPEPVTDAIPQRLYADQALPVAPLAPRPEARDDKRAYRIADLNDLGRPVEPGRFYDASYRPALSAMVDYVLSVEGPIYEELLIRRIARAHDIQRVGPLVREAIADRIDASVARTDDDGRPVLWPPGEESHTIYPHRPASAAVRSHIDTPMPELVGIATTLPSNASEAERARMIGQRLGLSRIEASTRARFERASELAASRLDRKTGMRFEIVTFPGWLSSDHCQSTPNCARLIQTGTSSLP